MYKFRSIRSAHNLPRACRPATYVLLVVFASLLADSSAQNQVVLNFDPTQSTISFTLGDTLHTVHGGFALKRGALNYNPGTGEVNGKLIVDAASGHSGNSMRDKKMHKEILESPKFPDIVFSPDRFEGKLGMQGTSTIQVHGIFSIHGADHEMTLPIQVEMAQDHWVATAHFVIPYAQWGMKNPSTFILRVSESVEIDVHASGRIPTAQ